MAESVFTNGLLLFAGLNLQAQIREITLSLSSEPQDVTALDDSSRSRLGGLQDVALSAAGYWDAAEPDASLFAAQGVADSLITATPTTTIGGAAYFFRALLGEYNPIDGGTVGDPHGFALEAGANLGDLYRGTLMENATFAATGNGTGRQIGAVSASETLFAGIHITAITGDWDIVIESDDNSGFLSAATRMTFAGLTTIGDQFNSVAGAITDDFWRIRFVENSAGSITLVSSLSIQ
jgi:hypothetical protein